MSWDRDAMFAWGAAMGAEQKTKGTNVMLGPGINLARTPWCGRNFEYQGEDPYLASQLVAPEVQGIQSNNVSACIKHYTVNAIEQDRSGMNVVVDQRTWMETYSRGFQAAVDAGVGTAMCSYNRVNGERRLRAAALLPVG
jgi:beta-glucosidase